MQASRSQLLPSSNGTCVSEQLLTSPVVETGEMHGSKSLLYRSDGGVGEGAGMNGRNTALS